MFRKIYEHTALGVVLLVIGVGDAQCLQVVFLVSVAVDWRRPRYSPLLGLTVGFTAALQQLAPAWNNLVCQLPAFHVLVRMLNNGFGTKGDGNF